MNDAKIEELCRKFGIEGEYRSYEKVTSGHINQTYKAYFFRGGEVKDYILQKVNERFRYIRSIFPFSKGYDR